MSFTRAVPGVVVIRVENSVRHWREIHDGYTLCATMPPEGGTSVGQIRYRRWSYETRPGQLLLMEPGELHVTRAIQGAATFDLVHIE
ncbi:MAG TPA: AraC family ligand binding domain-containing protein, partial [Polyangiales bacterium]|nr:AraC family ligand binding domain-containing protein [Polyangiales bacterium]